jgi:tetratricopeptide (TPR) repeat protein
MSIKIFKAPLIIIVSLILGCYAGYYLAVTSDDKISLSYTAELAAYRMLQDNKISKAIHYYNVSKHYNPENPDLYMNLGKIYYNLGLYEMSAEEFNSVIEKGFISEAIKDKNSETFNKRFQAIVYCYLGDIYANLSRNEESLTNYSFAVKEFPELPQYLALSIKMMIDEEIIKNKERYETSLLYLTFLKGLSKTGMLTEDILKQIDRFKREIGPDI